MANSDELLRQLTRIADALETLTSQHVGPPATIRSRFCSECGSEVRADHAGYYDHAAGCLKAAAHLPPTKDYNCAANCGHSINAHAERGCGVGSCACEAPYGRILPADRPSSDPLPVDMPTL